MSSCHLTWDVKSSDRLVRENSVSVYCNKQAGAKTGGIYIRATKVETTLGESSVLFCSILKLQLTSRGILRE